MRIDGGTLWGDLWEEKGRPRGPQGEDAQSVIRLCEDVIIKPY